jgi:hypothetical protein
VTGGGRQDGRGEGGGLGLPDSVADDLVALLYGELGADEEREVRARVAGDPALSTRLAELERVRSLYRELPEAEPPSRLTAQLMAQAAQRAPGRAESRDRGADRSESGLWARLRSWMQPLVAHPGLTAAASLIVVAGVASVLVLRGGELTRPPDRAVEAPAETMPAAREAPAADPAPGYVGGDPDVVEPGAEDRQGAAAGSGGAAAESAGPADSPSDTATADDKTGAPARRSRRSKASSAASRDDRAEQEKMKESSPGGALGMSEEKRAAEGGGSASQSDEAAGAPAESEYAEPPPPAPTSSAPEQSAPAKPSATRAVPPPSPAALHERALTAAAARRCLEVRSLGDTIRNLDAAYHDKVFRTDRRLAVCLSTGKGGKAK